MLKFLITSVGFNDAQRYVSTVTTITAFLAVVIARPNPAHILRKPEKWTFSVFIGTSSPRQALCHAPLTQPQTSMPLRMHRFAG